MANVSLDLFIPLVRAFAPGVPDPVTSQMLRLAAKEFFDKTRLWRITQTVAISANPFALGLPHTTVVAVESAHFGTAPLTPTAYADVSQEEKAATGTPSILTEEMPGVFMILPFAAGDVEAVIYLSLQEGPQFGVSGGTTLQDAQGQVPDFLFHEHANCIANGALAKLRAVPGQSYSDAGAANYHDAIFQGAINSLSSRSVIGKQRARHRTTARFM